jgi:hypothetical protein
MVHLPFRVRTLFGAVLVAAMILLAFHARLRGRGSPPGLEEMHAVALTPRTPASSARLSLSEKSADFNLEAAIGAGSIAVVDPVTGAMSDEVRELPTVLWWQPTLHESQVSPTVSPSCELSACARSLCPPSGLCLLTVQSRASVRTCPSGACVVTDNRLVHRSNGSSADGMHCL